MTLAGNTATSQGGAIWAAGATTYVENSTIRGNQAAYHAGIANENGTVTVVHSTIVENNAVGTNSNGGGLSHLDFGSATTILENSIVALNSADSGPDVYKNGGAVTPGGANLIGNHDTVSGEFPQGPLVGTQFGPLNPVLGPLGDNGGPTSTMLPLAGSPAIDGAIATVNSPATDQRGAPRSGGLDDLGAVELAECGNGILNAGEACDDGNSLDGDCCSATCGFESLFSACDLDMSVCTVDFCNGGGLCLPASSPVLCYDGNPCTDDQCNDATGCVFTNNTTSCDDGDSCTTADTCGGGVCLGGPPPAMPGSVPLLEALDATTWTWTPAVDAAGYDVVSGDLSLLSSSNGDYSTSTTGCLANDQDVTTLGYAGEPALGDGFFVLVRGENCTGSGTYDMGSPSQVDSRDAEVDAAPITCSLGDCPCWPGGPQEIAALHAATHPATSCNIASAAPSPTRSYTALFSYNGAVQDEFATQVFTGYFGRPVGQNYCQSYSSCSDSGQSCDPGVWNPPPDVDMPITPGESTACIQAFEAAMSIIPGCN
ncbi:MAG: choice-of-anchor Q domain-containing protein [Gemmatimonadales bacterium]